MPYPFVPGKENMILAKNAPQRALSIAGAYPWLLASSRKKIELRIWGEKKHRGMTFLHSSSGADYEDSFEEYSITRQQCPKFAIIGCAILTDVICYDRPEKWERDIEKHLWDDEYEAVLDCYGGRFPYGHVFEDAILFPEPILDVPGAYGYWQPKNDRQRLGFEKAITLLKTLS